MREATGAAGKLLPVCLWPLGPNLGSRLAQYSRGRIVMPDSIESNYTSLDAIRDLSDRDLAEATFLVLCALAERLTGHIPCVIQGNYDGMPNIIHGADGRVEWLRHSVSEPRGGSGGEQPHMQPATADTTGGVRSQ